jgi:hypothetical protein
MDETGSGSCPVTSVGSNGVENCGPVTEELGNVYSDSPEEGTSGQNVWLQILRSWVRFAALSDFLKSSGGWNGVHSAS